MTMAFEIDLGIDVNERQIEAGGKLPPGWYLAKIEDLVPDLQNPAMKILYKLTSSDYAGREVSDTLWDPEASDDAEKKKAAQGRLLLVTGRIGAREENSGKIDFRKAIAKDVVIELRLKQERICGACATTPPARVRKCQACGGAIIWKEDPDSFANVAYDGVYPLDHEKIPDDVRAALGITVAKRKAASGGGQPVVTASRGATRTATAAAARTPAVSHPPQSVAAMPSVSQEAALAAATDDF